MTCQYVGDIMLNLSTIDWTAIAALATALAMIATAFAAHAAYRASNTALDIDGRQTRRDEDRRKRNALAIAVPIMHELYLVEVKIKAALNLADAANDNVTKLTKVFAMIDAIKIPLLERFVDRFVDFDEKTATALGNALSVVLQMKMTKPLDLSGQAVIDAQLLPDNVKAAIGELTNTLTHVSAARSALQPHFEKVTQILA